MRPRGSVSESSGRNAHLRDLSRSVSTAGLESQFFCFSTSYWEVKGLEDNAKRCERLMHSRSPL